jgi:predicted aconitase with swiveling domain
LSEAEAGQVAAWQAELIFDESALRARYEALRPKSQPSLVVIGCPQASIGELRAVAAALRGRRVSADPAGPDSAPPLWIFTSATSKAVAEKTGLADAIRGAGALLLENTCPEVVPYDPAWVRHVLTNSMKAEHYIKSGLNGIPTSVMALADCVAVAAGERRFEVQPSSLSTPTGATSTSSSTLSRPSSPAGVTTATTLSGSGLPSQGDFTIRGEAFVTDAPITFLGFVNRQTGVVEEEGHPADGRSMAGKIAIFPRGTGSSVAPYVLLELFYRGVAPIAVINAEIDQQTAPACSLEGIPYAYGFGPGLFAAVADGDIVELSRREHTVTLRRVAGGT